MHLFNPRTLDTECECLSGQSQSGHDKKFHPAGDLGIHSESLYQRRKRDLPHCQETNNQECQLNPEVK